MIDPVKALYSGKFVRDVFWLQNFNAADIAEGQRRIGDTFATTAFCHEAYRRWGAQIRVQKEVSDDMIRSDLGNTLMDEIPWPAKAVEMFFEDERLPTLAIAKLEIKDIKTLFPGISIVESKQDPGNWINEKRVILCIQSAKGEALALNLVESIWDQVLFKNERWDMQDATPLNDEEDAVLKEALRLAIKVFAYASLPRYKPVPVTEITKRMGGKPGFKNRPTRPALRIVYLPTVHTQREDAHEPTGEGKKHAFKGRRGFFRTYRHDRYVKMKGKRIFVAPVAVNIEKVDTRQTFVVRKTS